MSGTSSRKVLLVGVACDLGAVVLVRVGVVLLLGGVKALIVIAAVGALRLVLRRPRATKGE